MQVVQGKPQSTYQLKYCYLCGVWAVVLCMNGGNELTEQGINKFKFLFFIMML